MSLIFSSQPGMYERHIRRLYQSPFYTQPITQEQVQKAKKMDDQALEKFQEHFKSLLDKAINLQANEKSEVVLELKEALEKAYAQCVCLSGQPQAWQEGLQKLLHIVTQTISQAAKEDLVAQNTLKDEVLARQQHFILLQNPFIADLLHPDCPIASSDLLPELCNEAKNSLHDILPLFTLEQLEQLQTQIRSHIESHKFSSTDLSQLETVLRSLQDAMISSQANLDSNHRNCI